MTSRRAGLLLLLLAAALMAGRFARLDLAAFINDEPRFLEAARDQVRTGQWLSASPIPGTLGVRYGPTVFWLYGLVGLVFGDHPRVAIVAMCAAVSLAQVALALAVARAFGGGAPMQATLLALVASSPYQFFWSRLAWDQTVDACSAAVVAILALAVRPGWPAGLAAGALLGLAVSSHLMVLPFVGAVILALAWEVWSTRERRGPWLAFAATAGVAALLVTSPYLRFLAGSPLAARGAVPLDVRTLGAYALEPARVATVWGIEYFFDDDWREFQRWLGGYAMLLRGGSALALLVAGATLLGLVAALRSPEPRRRRLGRLGLITWALAAPVLATRALARHPHYQFGTWWLVVVGVAGALFWLRERWPAAWRAGAGAVWLVAALQCGFIGAWLGYVDERAGTRGIHYSTPVGHQEAVMQTLCGRPEPRIVLQNETELFRRPLVYWSEILPGCRGKEVIICDAGSRVRPGSCPDPGPGGRRVRLVYARKSGGALRLEPED